MPQLKTRDGIPLHVDYDQPGGPVVVVSKPGSHMATCYWGGGKQDWYHRKTQAALDHELEIRAQGLKAPTKPMSIGSRFD